MCPEPVLSSFKRTLPNNNNNELDQVIMPYSLETRTISKWVTIIVTIMGNHQQAVVVVVLVLRKPIIIGCEENEGCLPA